jgi:long-chain acyl-CoA synthetase
MPRVRSGDLSWPLQRAQRLFRSVVAIVDGERRLTYEQLARRVWSLGGALDGLGCEPGARVGFLGANSLAHVEFLLAVPAFGRVLTDLNFRLSEPELAFMVRDSGVEVLVVDPEQLDTARGLRDACANLRQLVFDGSGPCPEDCLRYEDLITGPPADPPGVDQDAPAVISYTGGTTGTPRGVVLSHANLLANAGHNLIATGHRAEDRWLHVCPMFHVAGTANVIACTWVGSRQVVLPRFAAGDLIDVIERERISHTVLVPTMLAMLLEALEHRPADLSSLRHVQYAASPITPDLQRRVLDRLPCDIAQFYGMTEAAPTVSQCTPQDHRRGHAGEEPYRTRLASIGAPVVGVQAEVRGQRGERLALGEIGEVWVSGPNVMLGYWQRPEATAAALIDGWYRTGDAAYADADGYLYVVDRLKDMIITGGENVYSIEVETTLCGHEAVLEAAVFGIPDPRWGEAVHAVVVVDPDHRAGVEELIAHCRARMATYKLPRRIELRDQPLPRSGAGKLLKNPLREPYWKGRERRIS